MPIKTCEWYLPSISERCGTSDCGCAKDASLELRANRAVFSEVPKLEQVEATVTETSVYDPSVIQAVNQGDIRRVSDDKEGSVHSGHIHHQSPQSPLSMMDLMTLGMKPELIFVLIMIIHILE